MRAVVRPIVIGTIVLLFQWVFLGRMAIWGAYPDALLLFVAWLGLRYGRRWGAIGGFVVGFLMDAIYMTWGMNMLAKTIIGFTLGLVPATERETLLILPRQALIGGFLIAFVHYGIFVVLLALQAGTRNSFLITGLWLGSALYTAVIATIGSVLGNR